MATLEKLTTTRSKEHRLEELSPFELKDELIRLAGITNREYALTMLNAGRGNPNWTATPPREAFYALGQFAIGECRRVMDSKVGLSGIPEKKGIAKRLEAFIAAHKDMPGVELIKQVYKYGVKEHGMDADSWVLELAEGIEGDQYPTPVRMLAGCERIVHDYLIQEMCGGKQPRSGRYDLFATEGGTAAMCYIFDSLVENGLLQKGDRIAIGAPIFTPYLEIPELDRFNFKVTYVNGIALDKDGNETFQYPDEELDKLGDKKIKAFFIVNPSNPTSVMISEKSRKYLVKVVKNLNPNLMILTDDVYGTFVPGFTSLMQDLPENTLCVYSFSKYFGATGWRLGVIALHENNIYDDMLTAIPQKEKDRQAKMYENLTLTPQKLKFIDRIVADSRDVALNHTAGLSTPQQIQMMLFAAFALFDKKGAYKQAAINLLRNRYKLMWEGLEWPVVADPNRAAYYCEIDIATWAKKTHGKEFFAWLEKNFEPVDVVFRLAEECSVVLLNGGGFAGPEWSVRVSLANLNEADYAKIGTILKMTLNEYVEAWKQKTK
ncbi:aspartate 4-decarboxylase [uncultured Alistipes sp.]|jgi:aspartate 4-decarboxylase|uniref:aspartate 4-decarboxylase n=1 Tax=uncultured Alistipes sp. TaxID=538949 RepID=UPI0025FC91AF|nr:aspartate 4-decarboxylase [uncultured Alistipes sp.]